MTLYCNHCCKYQSVVKQDKKALCAVCNKVLGTFGDVKLVDDEHQSSSSLSVSVAGDEITGPSSV